MCVRDGQIASVLDQRVFSRNLISLIVVTNGYGLYKKGCEGGGRVDL